jgi:tetratricopeptide (TPR) repeat protein
VTDHPSPELLRRFALNDLAAAETDAVVVHLWRGCARCRSEVELHLPVELAQAADPAVPAASTATGADTDPAAPAPAPLDAYDRAIEAALASVRLHGTAAVEVRRRTHQILAELRAGDTPELPPPTPQAMPPRRARRPPQGAAGAGAGGADAGAGAGAGAAGADGAAAGGGAAAREARAAVSRRAAPRRFPLFDAALRYSWELRQDDPARMIELARFATRLAPTLGEDGYTAVQVADFEARAWGELANAYRVGEQPALADEAIAKAFGLRARGTGDELLEARLLSLQASVLGSSGRIHAALEVLSRLRKIHLRRGDRHNAGRALAQAGFYLGYWGLSEVALRTVGESMAMIDAEVDPALYLNTLQTYIDLLVDCRRFQEARDQLRQHRSRLLAGQGLLARVRLKTIEGRLEVGLGNLERAARAFTMARRRFHGAGSRRLAAMAGLDLAAVRMRQGRFADANPPIEQAVAELVAVEATGEALTALQLLRTNHGISKLTAAQVQDAADVLRRSSRSDPGGR